MRILTDILMSLDPLMAELHLLIPPPQTNSVPAGGNVQTAINSAIAGDIIVLQAGVRYVTGELQLPAKSGLVTIRSSATLPDRRLTPADAPLLPILASGNNGKVINGTGATHWKFDGIQFESTANGAGEVITLQDAEDVTFDRILIIGGANGQKRGIRGNGKSIALKRSHLANIWAPGQDSQAFCAWDGAGPYTIKDNYLEAASENVMFGGSDGGTASSLPSDILIEGNTFFKPLSWKNTGKAIKNLLELKVGKRVNVRNNIFLNNWADAQSGFAILFKVVNQDGANPWNATEDVVFEGNTVLGVDAGINLSGYDYNQPSGRATRITIRNNVILTTGAAFQAGSELGIVTIDHNQIQQGGNLLTLYTGDVWPAGIGLRTAAFAIEDLTFTNNRSKDVPYGIKGSGYASGTASLAGFCSHYVYSGNEVGP